MATNPFEQLDVIRKASAKGRQIKDCYRLMFKKGLWIKAYSKLAPNPGNLTPGSDCQTIDGFSLRLVDDLIAQIREGKFRFTPVRRVYIPKNNGKGKRPLGIPNFRDKLVQEVMKMILENVFEPIFSENSHGFRPNRSCLTALSQIKNTWKGLIWCIEGDIKGCFDNIDHKTLKSIIERKINDRRFILLLDNALKCGYMEDWKYNRTFSGTPQGGIISPILANIFLNEFDQYMDSLMEQFNTGKVRRRNKEYTKLGFQIYQRRKKIKNGNRIHKTSHWAKRSTFVQEIRKLKQLQREIISIDPFDPNYRRMKYVRYADDFVIGIAGSKREAAEVKSLVNNFLTTLKLELSEDKTLITHLENNIQFLGYQFKRWNRDRVVRVKYKNHSHPLTKRTLSGAIKLEIPYSKMVGYAKKQKYGTLDTLKSNHRTRLINNSELEILYTYNTELRGFANYYRIANNYHHLDPLFHLAQYSFLKTIANKRKSTVRKVAHSMRKFLQSELSLKTGSKNNEKIHKLVRLKHLPKHKGALKTDSPGIDQVLNTMKYSASSELERRLMANQCEACGTSKGVMEVHHVRKLKDIRKRKNIKWLDKIMIERNRKTLILCYDCHHKHHERQLPIDQLESVVH